MQGCKKNDRACQQKLYAQFYPAFFALCKTFFSDNHDVLTALNDGMLKVFKNIDKFDESKGDFFNWAYTIIRNSALNLVVKKKNTLTYELNEQLIEIKGYNPFRHLEWKDIYYYLGQLQFNTRCVCSLFYLEGFSIKEIVKSLDMKEGTVKWHLNECRNKLKKIFENIQNSEKSA